MGRTRRCPRFGRGLVHGGPGMENQKRTPVSIGAVVSGTKIKKNKKAPWTMGSKGPGGDNKDLELTPCVTIRAHARNNATRTRMPAGLLTRMPAGLLTIHAHSRNKKKNVQNLDIRQNDMFTFLYNAASNPRINKTFMKFRSG